LQPIAFDIEGTSSVVTAAFSDGNREVIWDGSEFTEHYALTSSRQFADGLYAFVVRPRGGWRSSQVSIDVVADAVVVDSGDSDLPTVL
jgi:hypothetical protein